MTHQDDIALLPSYIMRDTFPLVQDGPALHALDRIKAALTPPTDAERADVLEQARNSAVYSDVVTLPIPVYERMKAALTQPARLPVIPHLKTALMNAVAPSYDIHVTCGECMREITADNGEWLLWCGTKEHADAILQAARAYQAASMGQPQSQWQDISTAPKDGTRVLVCDGYEVTDAYFDKGEWWLYQCGDDWYSVSINPTHWMPLPPKPSADDMG